jgi:hypothetical protein
MTQTITTYPEMNGQIVGILRLGGTSPDLYAAARIEELEAEVKRLLDERAEWIEAVRHVLPVIAIKAEASASEGSEIMRMFGGMSKESP